MRRVRRVRGLLCLHGLSCSRRLALEGRLLTIAREPCLQGRPNIGLVGNLVWLLVPIAGLSRVIWELAVTAGTVWCDGIIAERARLRTRRPG